MKSRVTFCRDINRKTESEKKQYKKILSNQIHRLAKIYTSRPVELGNMAWHRRVGEIQADAIREKRSIRFY
jgi:hypothetical protein